MRFWVDGRLVTESEASVGVLDHGFTVGDGVFETFKVVHDPVVGVVPFAMDRHIARLAASARAMGLRLPDADEVRDALLAVCAANPELADGGRLRITYTSGPGPLGSDRLDQTTTLAVAASSPTAWPATTSLALSPWPRNERSPLAGVKSTSYAENVLALARAKSVGGDEALLANLAGDVCEGTASNVFLVEDRTLISPPLSTGCLAGITRALVLQWCAEEGIPVLEETMPVAGLTAVEEVFITSSTRDVHPVTRILDESGAEIWSEPVGPVTSSVAELFADRAGRDWNP